VDGDASVGGIHARRRSESRTGRQHDAQHHDARCGGLARTSLASAQKGMTGKTIKSSLKYSEQPTLGGNVVGSSKAAIRCSRTSTF
jgi:hypothetical protein